MILADFLVSVRGSPVAPGNSEENPSGIADVNGGGHNCVGEFLPRLSDPIGSLCNRAPSCPCHTVFGSPGRAEQKVDGRRLWGRPRDAASVPVAENLEMPHSIVRASVLGRPRSNVVAEESNEGRIRWMSRVPHRIDQDECRCNERFCNIPTRDCLGAKQTPRLVLQLAMMDREIEAGLWDGGLDKITGLGSVAVGTRMDLSWQRPTPYEPAAVSTQ